MLAPLLAAIFVCRQAAPLTPYELTPGFWVSLPSPPKTLELPTDPGETAIKSQKYWRSGVGNLVYVMSTFSVAHTGAPTSPDRALANLAAGLADGAHGQVTAQQDLLLNGWPGLEVTISINGAVRGWARNYVQGDYAFQVSAFLTRPDGSASAARAVFDTIRLPGGKGPLTVAGPQFSVYTVPETTVSVLMPGAPKTGEFPINDDVNGPKMQRASANYGSRTYTLVYCDLPAESLSKLSPDQVEGRLGALNRFIVSAIKAQNPTSHSYKLNGLNVTSTQFDAYDGKASGRFDSLLLGHRFYGFLSLVPLALRGSPEVARFYGSIKLSSD